MLSKLTIKTRLIAVIVFLSLQLIAGGVVGIGSLAWTNQQMQSMYDDRLLPLTELDMAIRGINFNQLAVARAITSGADVTEQLRQVDEMIIKLNKAFKAYLDHPKSEAEQALSTKMVEHRKIFVEQGLKPTLAALRTGDMKKAAELVQGPMDKLYQPVQADIDALIRYHKEQAHHEFERAQEIYRWVWVSCSVAVSLGVLLAAIVGFWLVRAITRPLNQAVQVARTVAGGDLSQQIEVKTQDETGQLTLALKEMNESLGHMVGQVRGSTEVIATAASEIANGNLDLSSRTEEQASSLEETASAMEELTSTVQQNAENARQANSMAGQAMQVAERGGKTVSEVVGTMDAINKASHRIVEIISVIDGIAFQTNILALNAAVEAARAGEQGRGFAVVATEVRNLAQRSASAAREIKGLIQDSVEKVDSGSRLVNEAGQTMEQVVASVKRVAEIVAEISAASAEQSTGIEQVNQAISQMDQVTQQNAALVEQAAAAAASLDEQASQLNHLVSVFRLSSTQSANLSLAFSAPAQAKRELTFQETARAA